MKYIYILYLFGVYGNDAPLSVSAMEYHGIERCVEAGKLILAKVPRVKAVCVKK